MLRFDASTVRLFLALLAMWMAVVGCGVSVTHTHADAEAVHVHGFGCFHLTSVEATGHRHSPCGGEPHQHLILLGLELPGVPVCDTGLPGPATDECGPATGTDCDSPPSDVLLDPALPVLAFWLPEIEPHDRPTPSRSDERVAHLSAFALHAVAGVLRS